MKKDIEKVDWVFDRINIIGEELGEMEQIYLKDIPGDENPDSDGELVKKLLELSNKLNVVSKNLNALKEKVIEARIVTENKEKKEKI